MRVLISIAHFYEQSGGEYGSTKAGAAERSDALKAAICALHATLGSRQAFIDIKRRRVSPANGGAAGNSLDIALCTTGDRHLVAALDLPPAMFTHVRSDAQPRLLGFSCHQLLRRNLGNYDLYAFMEDDLVIHDPMFLQKIRWFTALVGKDALLQPHRYETSWDGPVNKLYIDPDLAERFTQPYQNIADRPQLKGTVMGRDITFRRTTNPHSGCFFLTAEQMEHWARQPWFLDRDCGFIGPLESAASLGVMRTFRIYKPAWENAGFLELEHAGRRVLNANITIQEDGSWTGKV